MYWKVGECNLSLGSMLLASSKATYRKCNRNTCKTTKSYSIRFQYLLH